MKVLMIRSNPVSPDPRLEKAAKALGRNGYNVEILAWDRICKHAKIEAKDYYKICRIRIKAPYGKPLLLFILPIWLVCEFVFLLKNDFDIVHACDLDTLIPAVIVSKIKNKKLIFDSCDFYADCIPGIPKFLRRIISNVEIYFAKRANYVILADESRIEQYEGKLTKTVIINNVPMDDYGSKVIQDDRDGQILFQIFYAGILDRCRGFEHVVKAINDLDNVRLMIAGFGVDEEYLVDLFKRTNNVIYLGKIRYDEVIERTKKSDLLFALYDPRIPNHIYASPNKVFEAMMCGKPIIVSDGTSMANIVRTENCGLVVPYGDVNAIQNAIIRLKEDKNFREYLGQNGRKAYERKYSWDIMEERLLDIYHRVTL